MGWIDIWPSVYDVSSLLGDDMALPLVLLE